MATQKSPLVGYNHNLKYKGRVYHVQTEDSGLDTPHVITHLFHDGTILNTTKQEYHDLVGISDWEHQLRARMQNQHKDMMKGLIRGQFDDRIVMFFGVVEAEVEEEAPMATLQPPGVMGAPEPSPPAAPPSAPWDPASASRPPAPAATPQAPAAARSPGSGAGAGVVVAMPMVIVGNQPASPAAAPPPPSASVSRVPPPVPGGSGAPPVPGGSGAPTEEYRPTESRQVPDSIFGSELISEKSLDEVILAYLSEDMTED